MKKKIALILTVAILSVMGMALQFSSHAKEPEKIAGMTILEEMISCDSAAPDGWEE